MNPTEGKSEERLTLVRRGAKVPDDGTRWWQELPADLSPEHLSAAGYEIVEFVPASKLSEAEADRDAAYKAEELLQRVLVEAQEEFERRAQRADAEIEGPGGTEGDYYEAKTYVAAASYLHDKLAELSSEQGSGSSAGSPGEGQGTSAERSAGAVSRSASPTPPSAASTSSRGGDANAPDPVRQSGRNRPHVTEGRSAVDAGRPSETSWSTLIGEAREALAAFDDHGDYEAPVQALREIVGEQGEECTCPDDGKSALCPIHGHRRKGTGQVDDGSPLQDLAKWCETEAIEAAGDREQAESESSRLVAGTRVAIYNQVEARINELLPTQPIDKNPSEEEQR